MTKRYHLRKGLKSPQVIGEYETRSEAEIAFNGLIDAPGNRRTFFEVVDTVSGNAVVSTCGGR